MDWSYGSSKELTLQGQENRGIILLNLLKFCYFTTPHRYHGFKYQNFFRPANYRWIFQKVSLGQPPKRQRVKNRTLSLKVGRYQKKIQSFLSTEKGTYLLWGWGKIIKNSIKFLLIPEYEFWPPISTFFIFSLCIIIETFIIS